MKLQWGRLLGCIIGVELIGNIGSLATFSQISSWYAALTKPAFNPPNGIFGPVWTLFYLMMGISFYIVWNTKNHANERRPAFL